MKSTRKTSYLAYQNREVPYIRISGKWLEDLGFEIGSTFQIQTNDKQIILNPTKEEGVRNDFPKS